jgi:hypothetical protein
MKQPVKCPNCQAPTNAAISHCLVCLAELKPIQFEAQLQASCVALHQAKYEFDGSLAVHYVLNQTNAIAGMKARAAGAKKSTPDIIIFSPKGRTTFVELKLPGKAPDKDQKAMHKRLKNIGFEVHIATTLHEFNELCRNLQ